MTFKQGYVFLDTNIYVRESYRFRGNALGKLLRLSRDGELRILVPDIVKQEVSFKLREAAEDHIGRLKSALDSNILGLIGEKQRNKLGLLIDIDDEKALREIDETWGSYIRDSNAEHVQMDGIDLSKIITDYFHANPPFAKGRKKSEFPDAFAIASIMSFADKNPGNSVYVVSNDNGVLDALSVDDRFHCYKDLSELLDEYNRHTEALSPAAHNLMESNVEWISEVIAEKLYNNPSIYAYEHRLDQVHIERVEVDVTEINLVEIGLTRALFDVEIMYYIEAEVFDMVRVGYDEYDWDVFPRRFDGTTTIYLEIQVNNDFSQLQEIVSAEF